MGSIQKVIHNVKKGHPIFNNLYSAAHFLHRVETFYKISAAIFYCSVFLGKIMHIIFDALKIFPKKVGVFLQGSEK